MRLKEKKNLSGILQHCPLWDLAEDTFKALYKTLCLKFVLVHEEKNSVQFNVIIAAWAKQVSRN
jgi:hypothetical protein